MGGPGCSGRRDHPDRVRQPRRRRHRAVRIRGACCHIRALSRETQRHGERRPGGERVAPGLKPRNFRGGSKKTPTTAKKKSGKTGTTIAHTLSEDATVELTIERGLDSRRVGNKCRKAARRPRRKRKRCIRYVAVGTLTRSAKQGANSIAFSGRIGSRRLHGGRYRATITATDAAGNISEYERDDFRVLRKKKGLKKR